MKNLVYIYEYFSSVFQVNCSVRGDLGPACNSAGMIDRYFVGIEHLYRKPSYKNLRVCTFKYVVLGFRGQQKYVFFNLI